MTPAFRFKRTPLAALLLGLALHAAQAAALQLDLPAQPLSQALAQLARQAGLQLLLAPDILQDRQAAALHGPRGLPDALAELLRGTGLRGRLDGSTLVIERLASVVSLPEVRVTALAERESATGPVIGYVAKRSATGTKTDTAIIETPQSISVIGREELDARGAQDMAQAIRYTPGVTTSTYGVDNRGYEFLLMRGFDGAARESYRDGLGQASFVDIVSLTETYGLERVEVLRGPSSMLFGGGDVGGIINRTSKRPTGEALREVELQYGSFDRQQLALDVGDRLKDDGSLAFRVVGLGMQGNSNHVRYPNGDELKNERFYLAPSLRWKPSAATSFTMLAEMLENQAADDIWILAGPAGERTNLLEGEPSYSQIKQSQASIGYQFEHQFDSTWVLKQNFRQNRSSANKHHVFSSWEPDNRTLSRTAALEQDTLHQTVWDMQLQGKEQVGQTQHTVLLGIDWNRVKGINQETTGPAPSLDLYAPVYGVAIPEPTALAIDYTQTTRQLGVYVQDQIKWGHHWVVTLGGRQDHVTTTTDDRFNATYSTQSDSVFSGRAGLTYLVGNGWAPYLAYAESFLPNSGVDANSQPFKPSQGKQMEMGIKYQPESSNALFTAAVFDLNKTNVVTYDDITGDARQTGKQRARGIELEAKAELMRGFNATAAYTRLAMRVLESANAVELGKTPILVPRQMASVWLDYALGGGFGLGGGVRYVGSIWNDESNTSAQPGFTLVDAALRYDQGPWRFALNASNLFNKQYLSSRVYGGYYVGAERSVALSVKYHW